MEYLHGSVQPLWWRWLFTRRGIFDGSGDHRVVSGCDRQRDHEELPGGICADSNWPFADVVSLDRNSDLQCFTKSCSLDCDSVVWRFRSTRLSLVILGSSDLWRRGGRHYRSLAPSGVASSQSAVGPKRTRESSTAPSGSLGTAHHIDRCYCGQTFSGSRR